MKILNKYIMLLFLVGVVSTAIGDDRVGPKSGSIITLQNHQAIDFDQGLGEEQVFRIWIPHNAAHLRVSLLSQRTHQFIYTNHGSIPEFNFPIRPDCEFPAYKLLSQGTPSEVLFRSCVFHRPESGDYHYIIVNTESYGSIDGNLNRLHVSYEPNGLSNVADVHMDATYVRFFDNSTLTTSVHSNSGDSDAAQASFLSMKYDESLGRFEERANGLCDAGIAQNPTYLKLELFHSEPIDSCSYRGSWDLQEHVCSQSMVNAINNTQRTFVINTDEYDTIFDGNQCIPNVNSIHMEAINSGATTSINHYFEFTAVIRGQGYPRRVTIRKRNGTY